MTAPSTWQPRHGAGTSRGGQFAPSARDEADVALAVVRAPHADWAVPASDPYTWLGRGADGLDTQAGSFDRCKFVSATYTTHLLGQGVDATWVQVVRRLTPAENCHPRWRETEPTYWQHYVTRIRSADGTLRYVDWTNRQFEPDSDWPLVVDADEYEAQWGETYDLPADVVANYLTHTSHR